MSQINNLDSWGAFTCWRFFTYLLGTFSVTIILDSKCVLVSRKWTSPTDEILNWMLWMNKPWAITSWQKIKNSVKSKQLKGPQIIQGNPANLKNPNHKHFVKPYDRRNHWERSNLSRKGTREHTLAAPKDYTASERRALAIRLVKSWRLRKPFAVELLVRTVWTNGSIYFENWK